MPEVSLIFGFRNREIKRVENCIRSLASQSVKDFEVIFVDYGSDPLVSEELKTMLKAYPFVRYVFNNTIGRPWNRSHALNTGIRLAASEYVINLDIDLIFSSDYVKKFCEKRNANKVVYSHFYSLPENFKGDPLSSSQAFEVHTGATGIGIYPKEKLEAIGSFDEYYRVWGCEDRDLKYRLEQTGVEQEIMPITEAPVYHQWHPQTNFARNFLPVGWWEDMNFHFYKYKPELVRNNGKWGSVLSKEQRPSLSSLDSGKTINEYDATRYSSLTAFFEELTEKFHLLRSGEHLKCKYRDIEGKFEFMSAVPQSTVYRSLNKMVYTLNRDYRILNFSLLNRKFVEMNSVNLYGMKLDELKNFAWIFLRTYESEIADYFYGNHNGSFTFIVVKK